MSYLALYRKYRPDTFEEVKGQDPIVTTLRNQIRSGRIAHALIFCGTRGTGKTSVAKIYAKAVNCENPADGSPCGECPSCRAIAAGTSMNVIEIDAASNNGVDNIRQIREEVAYAPTQGKYKVYIIDEVHMLSAGAFNALLKTLEEPPAYVVFILATTEAHKVPVTIMSRCQRYDFRRITQEEIVGRLRELMEKEKIPVQEKALRYLARKADGGMRDALSLADQCISFYLGQELTYDKVLNILRAVDVEVLGSLYRKILAGDVKGIFSLLEEMIYRGRDLTQLVSDLIEYLRNLLLLVSVQPGERPQDENEGMDPTEELLDVPEENLIMLREDKRISSEETLMRYIRVLSELQNQMRYAVNRRVLTEVALIRLCRPQMQSDYLALADRVRQIEHKLEEGTFTVRQSDAPVSPGKQERAEPREQVSYDVPAPEDLQQIRSVWNSIAAGMRDPVFSSVLKTADLRFDPSEGKDPKIYIVIRNPVGELFVNQDEARTLLEQAISEKTGKKVPVRIFEEGLNEKDTAQLRSVKVEQMARERIHMEIETE